MEVKPLLPDVAQMCAVRLLLPLLLLLCRAAAAFGASGRASYQVEALQPWRVVVFTAIDSWTAVRAAQCTCFHKAPAQWLPPFACAVRVRQTTLRLAPPTAEGITHSKQLDL